MFKPTQEQIEIIKAFNKNKVLKVNACAGSGKSTTLRLLAEANKVPSLYICFNKSIALEAAEKFPMHVDCKTTHAVAYVKHGLPIAHKLSRPVGRWVNIAKSPSEIASYYKVQEFECGEDSIKPNAIAALAKSTVNRYENSAEKEISSKLINKAEISAIVESYPTIDYKQLVRIILALAKRLWKDRIDPRAPVFAEHNTYLKLWQLAGEKLDYEIIYLDEAQDSNPAVLDVIKKQTHCKVCYVGDTYQSIYAFRQAINAMETIQAPSLMLSKSFRYGQQIADAATFIIDGAMTIEGFDGINSEVTTVTEDKYTMIFRTNAALIDKAVELVSKGKKVNCNVDTYKFKSQLESALALYNRDYKKVKDEDIAIYSSWLELKNASEEERELKRLVKIVENNKAKLYLSALEELKTKNSNYDILLTTAHKSKGMEWDYVIIAEDFDTETLIKLEGQEGYNQQEINLFYVAVTRAIKKVQLPFLYDAIFKEAMIAYYRSALECME